jgi:hypothetical protein
MMAIASQIQVCQERVHVKTECSVVVKTLSYKPEGCGLETR